MIESHNLYHLPVKAVMRKMQLALLFPLFVLAPICANAGTVTSSLGFQNFPEGVSPLPNRFTLENPPTGVFSVSFYIDDYDGLPLQVDNKGSDGWSKGPKISGVSVSGSTVSFAALSPIDALLQDAPPTDILAAAIVVRRTK